MPIRHVWTAYQTQADLDLHISFLSLIGTCVGAIELRTPKS